MAARRPRATSAGGADAMLAAGPGTQATGQRSGAVGAVDRAMARSPPGVEMCGRATGTGRAARRGLRDDDGDPAVG